jgi:hypothetical protein
MENNPDTPIDTHDIIKILEEFLFLWEFWSYYLSHVFTLTYFFLRVKYFDLIYWEFRSSEPIYYHIVRHQFPQIFLHTYFRDGVCSSWADRAPPWYFLVREPDFLPPKKNHISHHYIFVWVCCHWVCVLFLIPYRAPMHNFVLSCSVLQIVSDHPWIVLYVFYCVLLWADFESVSVIVGFYFLSVRSFIDNHLGRYTLIISSLCGKKDAGGRQPYFGQKLLRSVSFYRPKVLYLFLWVSLFVFLVSMVWDSVLDMYRRVILLLSEQVHSMHE